MDRPWGTADTHEGRLIVGASTLRIQRTIPAVLRGWLLWWWRSASGPQRAWTLFRAGYVLFYVGLSVSIVWRSPLDTFELAIYAGSIVAGVVISLCAADYLHDTVLPIDSVRGLHLDPDERALTIVHDNDGGRLLGSASDPAETTLSFPTEDDVRTVRTALYRSGLADRFDASEPVPRDEPTERVVLADRFTVERGVVFCRRCDSQVSPADSACPSCDYQFRVERAATNEPS